MRGMVPMLSPSRSGMFRLWENPREGMRYVVGADVAEGKIRDQNFRKKTVLYIDERPDYSAAIVLEVESGMHVATFRGYIEPTEYAIVLAAIGAHYNNALMVPELNGPGIAVTEALSKAIGYPNLYRTKILNRVDGEELGVEYGWRTTVITRPLLIARISELVNHGYLQTRDAMLVSELRTMEYDRMGVPRAQGKRKDDMVLALGIALQARFELLNGLVGRKTDEYESLPSADRHIWRRIKRMQESSRERRDRFGRGVRRSPVLRRLGGPIQPVDLE